MNYRENVFVLSMQNSWKNCGVLPRLRTIFRSSMMLHNGLNLQVLRHSLHRIRTSPVAESGEDTVFPTTWRDAWNWARVRTHLESIEARDELLTLARRRREVETGLARFYHEMVAKAAWLATKKNATPKILAGFGWICHCDPKDRSRDWTERDALSPRCAGNDVRCCWGGALLDYESQPNFGSDAC